METLEWQPCQSYEYAGPLLFFKGDKVAQAAEQSQANFDNTLQGIFQAQYANQTQVLQYLQGKLQNALNNNQGYTPGQLTALRTGATDTTAQEAQNAQAGANAAAIRTGGSALPSGVSAMIESSVAQQAAQQQAQAQNAITTANANLQQQNFWNASNVLSGTAAQFNPLGYANSATSGSGAVAGLSNAVTNANGPTFGQILGGIGGGILGAAGSAGGFGKLFS